MSPPDHRRLRSTLIAYRLGDPAGQYPIYDGAGASLHPGRWNAKGEPMIYASEHYSLAMLEKLVHFSGDLPDGQCYIKIEIPRGCSYEALDAHSLPGWDSADSRKSRAFGSQWFQSRRSLVLMVPSVVSPLERNILLNPEHPQASGISVSNEVQAHWDERLYR